MTDPIYTSDQLALERKMSELGEERYHTHAAQARDKDRLSLTPPGRALLRSSLAKVENGLREWVSVCKSKPGKRASALPYIERLELPTVALLSTAVLVDGLHRPRAATALASAIGRTLEDEDRFRAFHRDNPGMWREITAKTKHSGPTHRRRVAVAVAGRTGDLPPKWPRRQCLYAGFVALEAFAQATGLVEFENVWISKKRKKLIVLPSETALEWLARADDRAASLSPLYLPTVDIPAEWEGIEGGGYLTDLVLRRPIARFHGKQHENLVRRADLQKQAPEILGSLNSLQSVSWRINEDVLEVLRHLANSGGGPLPQLRDEPLPPKLDATDIQDAVLRKAWRRQAGKIKKANFTRRSHRILVTRTVMVAELLRKQREFYYPHRLDFRGRAYPIPYWVQPQGPDVGRSLISFSEGMPLDQVGWDRLMIYGANLWGKGGTLQERRNWGERQIHQVQKTYEDPIEFCWWHEADEPFQFLAWCLEVGAALEAGWPRNEFLTTLPVHVDAKNNGLQLFGLMTGDRRLAELTCAIGPGGQDIYEAVASAALTTMQASSDPMLQAWVPHLPDGIPRPCAKRPVMTLAYGVTTWGAQDYVRRWYVDHFGGKEEDGPFGNQHGKYCRALTELILSEVEGLCEGAVAAMDWLHDVADLAVDQDSLFRWTAPSGWPVMQEYWKPRGKRVRALLGGAVRHLRLRERSNAICGRQQRQGAAPNYVHAVDAAIMARVTSRWQGPIAAVHDSFATHAPRVPQLLGELKQAVADIAVVSDPLFATRHEVQAYVRGKTVPFPPRLGTIDPQEVLDSEYLFS